MSRIGKNPIAIPAGVEITIDNGVVTAKGPKGVLTQNFELVNVEVEEGNVVVSRSGESKDEKSKHGLYRSLISNIIEGVNNGFKTTQELVGVGYRATVEGQLLELNLGYSHTIFMQIPDEVSVTAEAVKGKPPVVIFESMDKQLVGQVAAKLRSFRPPEPYKGKGIKFAGEVLRRKAGKTSSK
ncbi:MAG TPA: 50S ribosomal protein L6 [Bacteroidetes bacterium]|jgi:large subunit ribosomal protein L6|nr:50S ribosomal protein L6 [Bacteroidota bacterium]